MLDGLIEACFETFKLREPMPIASAHSRMAGSSVSDATFSSHSDGCSLVSGLSRNCIRGQPLSALRLPAFLPGPCRGKAKNANRRGSYMATLAKIYGRSLWKGI